VLEKQNAGVDRIADLVAERMGLAFLCLKSRIDPDDMQPALREPRGCAANLRRASRASQQAHRLGEADVDS